RSINGFPCTAYVDPGQKFRFASTQGLCVKSTVKQSCDSPVTERVSSAFHRRHGGEAMDPIGRRRWAIAEGYIPSESCSAERALVSHETACILNAGDQD